MTTEHGTTYHDGTPSDLVAVLEDCRIGGARITIRYGDPETGRDWLEENDCDGRIGRSWGPSKVPILLARSDSSGGGSLLDHCIVRVLSGGRELWRHPSYHRPTIEIREDPEWPGGRIAYVGGSEHARFRTAGERKRWERIVNS